MRRMRLLALLALSIGLLSGCFRYQSTVVVDEDGSGTAQELFVVDRSIAERLLGSDTDIEAHLPRAADFSLPDWADVRDYSQDGYEGVVMDVAFDEPAECNSRLNALHRYLAESAGSSVTSVVDLHAVDDGWEFTMRTAGLAGVPPPQGTDAGGFSDLYRDAELIIALQLPGRVIDHNADEQSDGRLIWRLSAGSVQTQLYARTSTSNALIGSARTSRPLQIATALATVGGLGVFAAVAVSRRRGGGGAIAEPAFPHLGDPVTADPGPPDTWPSAPPPTPPVQPGRPPQAGPPPQP